MKARAPLVTPYSALPDEEQEVTWAKLRQRCKDSMYFLAKGVIGFTDLTDSLHRPIANFLQLAPWNCPFPESRRKATIEPRNHFKSTLASVTKPIWLLLWDQQYTINLISAVEKNTVGWLGAIQHVFNTNELFRWLFPELIAKDNKWADESKHAFTIPRDEQLMPEPQPSIQATSIVSGQASKHVRHVSLDDPVNEMTVDSPRLVDRAVSLYKLLESTLQDFEDSSIDLTATPWGFGDVVEYALENEVKDGTMMLWKVGCYGNFQTSPQIQEYKKWQLPNSDRFMSTDQMLWKGKDGEPIFPARCPRVELERLEKKYGTFLFSCNYLCNPFDPSQSGFPTEIPRFQLKATGDITCICPDHATHTHNIRDLHIVMTVDPAFSDKDDAAESAITVGGLAEDGCRYLFKAWGDRVEPDVLWMKIVKTAIDFQPFLKEVGIESVSSQKLFRFWFEFLQQIMDKMPDDERHKIELVKDLVFQDLKPDNDIDKKRRIKTQQLPLANGYWHIQYGMEKFLDQYTKFPRARPCDVIDAWAYLDYMWNLPKKTKASQQSPMNWNVMRQDYHRRHRLYGT